MKIASIFRAGVLGLVLAAATLPAQAAGVQFHFGVGNGFDRHRVGCLIELTDRQIRNAVQSQGYRNIFLNVADSRRIQVRATKGGWVYLLRVSTCSGAILDRQRLRRS